MPWYTPNPQPGLPITSAWGNAIENASEPVYATVAALTAGWTDAPDGARAFVLADRRTYRRRGGAWARSLEVVQGIQARVAGAVGNVTPVVAPPGYATPPVGPFNLRGRRIYVATWQARLALLTATAQVTLGNHLNVTGTGADVPLTWHGGAPAFANGQEVLAATFNLPWQNAVVEQSWSGQLTTGGADDQVLSVTAQHVLNNTTAQISIAAAFLTFVDVGAAP